MGPADLGRVVPLGARRARLGRERQPHLQDVARRYESMKFVQPTRLVLALAPIAKSALY